jgi:hypothetical protein
MTRHFRSSGRCLAVILLAGITLPVGAFASTASVSDAAARYNLVTTTSGEDYRLPAFDRHLSIVSRMPFGVLSAR